jgi:ornithine cyclodeaminase
VPPPRWLDAEHVRRTVSADRARRLVRQRLADGFDPASDPPRLAPAAGDGQLLVMPATSAGAAGVKVLTVAPGNPERGLERIQAVYVLMDAATLSPSVLLDGTAITALRTPAVSAVAADALAPDDVRSVVIVGSGPQAVGHAEAILAIRAPETITVVGRRAEAARAMAARIAGIAPGVRTVGLHTGSWTAGEPTDGVADVDAVAEAIRGAQLVVTATSAATPVLEDDWVAAGACVVAIGSHEPHRRELPGSLLGRSLVVVEDLGTARREAGDVVLAAAQGHLSWDAVRTLADLVLGRFERATDRPNVFKSVGMAWQDLVVAEHASRL